MSLLGWCIGGTLCLLYGGLSPDNAVRNMALLTTPVDSRGSLYANWLARDSFDVDYVAESYKVVPGRAIDWANKLMKPVTNYGTTYRTLWEGVLSGARGTHPLFELVASDDVTRLTAPAATSG